MALQMGQHLTPVVSKSANVTAAAGSTTAATEINTNSVGPLPTNV